MIIRCSQPPKSLIIGKTIGLRNPRLCLHVIESHSVPGETDVVHRAGQQAEASPARASVGASVGRQHGERHAGAGVLDERHHLGVRQVADGHVVNGHDGVAHVQ